MAEEELVAKVKIGVNADPAPINELKGAVVDLLRDLKSMSGEAGKTSKETAELIRTAREVVAALRAQTAQHNELAAASRASAEASRAHKLATEGQNASIRQSVIAQQLETAELRNAYLPALLEKELRTKTFNEQRLRANASVAEATRESRIHYTQLRAEGAEIDLSTKSIRNRTAALREESAELSLKRRQAAGGFDNIPGVIQAAAMISSISVVAKALEAASSSFMGFNSLIETSSMQLKVLTGSADVAGQHLQDLQTFAVKTPFELPGLIEQSKMLQGYGFTVGEVIPVLTTLGDIAAGVGMDKLPRLTYALAEVKEKGRLMSQDLRQFESAGVPLLTELAHQFGVTQQQMKKMVEEGEVGFPQVAKALQKLADTKFSNMMMEMQSTFAGAVSSIKDSLRNLSTAFEPVFATVSSFAQMVSRVLQSDAAKNAAKGIADVFRSIGNGIKEFFNDLADSGSQLRQSIDGLLPILAMAAGAVAALLAVMTVQNAIAFASALRSAAAAAASLAMATLLPVAPILLVGAVAVAIAANINDLRDRFIDAMAAIPKAAAIGTGAIIGAFNKMAESVLRAIGSMSKGVGDFLSNLPMVGEGVAGALSGVARWAEQSADHFSTQAAAAETNTTLTLAELDKLRDGLKKSAQEGQDAIGGGLGAVIGAVGDKISEFATTALGSFDKVGWGGEDTFNGLGNGAKKAKKSLEELIAEYYALQAAMEAIKATVASGDLLGAARQLVALGKSNEQAVSEVISIQKELAREAEQALKDAADRAKEARSAFLDLADTLLGQVTKAFEALSGASSTSAQSVVKLIGTLGAQAGKALAGGFNIPLSATVYTKPGEGTTATAYAGPAAPFSGGADMGFGGRVGDILGRMATGLGVVPWMSGAGAGAGLIPGITAGMGGAAALAKAGASLDDINAGIDAAATALGQFGHWVGSNLTGELKQAAGSLIGGLQEYIQMAREAEGDAEKLAYLQKVIDALTPALQNAAKAAQEYADAVAAARKAGVYFGEYDTAAVLKAQTELVTKTRQEELEAARRNVEAQMQAQRTRGKYGFTEDVIARTAGGEETLYQNWFKARFGLTRSELDLANANWAMVEASQTRTKLLEMENEQMVKRTREAQSYQRSTEERIRSAYGITQAQLYGQEDVVTGDLRDTLAQLVLIMQRGINAYIEPNHAADKLGAALDQRSALLAGAGGYGPGVF